MRKRSLLAVLAISLLAASASFAADKPNVIFILADDMGFGDVGFNGQKKIKTPNLDKLAAEGMTFSAAYCGTSVCAPSRCTLMTGMHTGHAPVRANKEIKPEGQFPLPAGTYTVGRLFIQRRRLCHRLCREVGPWLLGIHRRPT